MNLIDEILVDWATERPEIDCGGKAVACGILQCYSHIVSNIEKALKPLGITPNMFSALVTIRRKGPKAEVTVKKIMQEALVTSGATSNLLNSLIEFGLIKKRKARKDEDARSVFVKLTPKGLALIDKAMEIQAACERKLTQALTKAEKQQLANLLTKMQSEEHSYA